MKLQSVSSFASFLLHTIWLNSVSFGSHTHPGGIIIGPKCFDRVTVVGL